MGYLNNTKFYIEKADLLVNPVKANIIANNYVSLNDVVQNITEGIGMAVGDFLPLVLEEDMTVVRQYSPTKSSSLSWIEPTPGHNAVVLGFGNPADPNRGASVLVSDVYVALTASEDNTDHYSDVAVTGTSASVRYTRPSGIGNTTISASDTLITLDAPGDGIIQLSGKNVILDKGVLSFDMSGTITTVSEAMLSLNTKDVVVGTGVGTVDINVITGGASSGETGGFLNLKTSGGTSGSTSGDVRIITGSPKTTGNSGGTRVSTGQVETGNSGAVTISSGVSSVAGNTGNVIISTGNATSGNSGNLTLAVGTASATRGKLQLSGINSYADDAAAGVAGLVAGDVYIASGAGAQIVGTLMVKQ